jgi:hypothetical protein
VEVEHHTLWICVFEGSEKLHIQVASPELELVTRGKNPPFFMNRAAAFQFATSHCAVISYNSNKN